MAQFIFPPVAVSLAGVATEATLLLVEANTADTVTELVSANVSLVSLASEDFATQTTLAAAAASLSSIAAEDFATQTTLASIDGKVLTDTQLRATPVPVSGPLTDAQLRAVAVPVSGPLTDAQLRATDVPVSASSLPLPTGAATEATLADVQTAVDALNARVAGSLVPEQFDYQDITYVPSGNGAGEIETVVYKTGGSGGTTVATLSLAYNVDNKLSSVTRS